MGSMGSNKCVVLLSIAVLLFSTGIEGVELQMFMAKYKTALQDYIMAGYGGDWKHCDILSDKRDGADIDVDIPHFTVTLENLPTIDPRSAFSSSHCLLASYEVNNVQKLASVIKFGWKAIQHKRIALILKMSSARPLTHSMNRTKLPFPVASGTETGEEHFICPLIGENEPILQKQMCEKSYVSLGKKTLRVGMVGYELIGEKFSH